MQKNVGKAWKSCIRGRDIRGSGHEPDYEQHFDVKEAFARLEEEERMILSYSVFAGYGSEEIAQMLEMNAATVRSKKSRALGKMRKMLEAG